MAKLGEQVINDRLFHSLGKQLKHEVFFVTDVGKPYYDVANDLEILDLIIRDSNIILSSTVA